MKKGYNENITPTNNSEKQKESITIIQTDIGEKNGHDKCPKCGATDISYVLEKGKLRCNFCRYEFGPEKVEGLKEDITRLEGKVFASGTQDIIADANDILTLKCEGCGSEVVIDTSEKTQARCHWCRNTLSINNQIPNGSIPDVVLPFGVTKEEAKKEIEKFVGKRKFFAHPKFKKEFSTANVMGVYFPYMLVDVNSHARFVGKGEHLVRKYTRGSGENKETYYDADLYEVEREFDLTINGLTIESSSDKLNRNSSEKTTNIINSIMPFDLENCVKWNANYLKGYTSERRDTNVVQLHPIVENQSKDVARFAANETMELYDRGVAWEKQEIIVKGEQWQAAYLPVWLYSYQQIKGNKKLLHYVAVNARTKETMGSVPIHMPRLLLISFIIEILGFFLMLFCEDFDLNWIFLTSGPIFYSAMYAKYRNKGARHKHEIETKRKMNNIRKVDKFITTKKGLRNSMMYGANNTEVSGESIGNNVLSNITKNIDINIK